MTFSKLPTNLQQEAIDLFNSGKTLGFIAKHFNANPYAVSIFFEKIGIRGRVKKHRMKGDEKILVLDYYNRCKSVKETMEFFKCCYKSVSDILSENNINPRKSIADKEMEQCIIADYKNGFGYEYILNKYKTSFYVVKNIFKNNNINSRPAKFHTIDECFFEKIDSHQKAYFIGLILADGCVRFNRPKTIIDKLSISLTEEDSYILDFFIKMTKYSGSLKYEDYNNRVKSNRRPCFKLSISSASFVSKLTQYGIHPNKSVNHPFFKNIPKEYLPSAILGYFDGDGSVSFSVKDGNRLSASFISSIEFAETLKKKLNEAGIKCFMRIRTTKSGFKMGEVRLKGNKSCLLLYKYMYSGNIQSLERKKLKFTKVIEQQALNLIKNTN